MLVVFWVRGGIESVAAQVDKILADSGDTISATELHCPARPEALGDLLEQVSNRGVLEEQEDQDLHALVRAEVEHHLILRVLTQ